MVTDNFIEQIRLETTGLEKKYARHLKEMFKNLSAELFERYPQVKAISWRQFTPYYCDGDPCEFRVYADWMETLEIWFGGREDFNSFYEYDTEHYSFDNGLTDAMIAVKPIYEAFSDFIEAFEDQQLQRIIRDEGIITLMRDGTIKVTEYDHD